MTRAALPVTPVEYLIYTFEFQREGKRGRSPWHRYAALADEELALAQAQILSDTHKYRRVEVKKKYFDPKRGRAVDATLRVYDSRVKDRRAGFWGFLIGFALVIIGAGALISLI